MIISRNTEYGCKSVTCQFSNTPTSAILTRCSSWMHREKSHRLESTNFYRTQKSRKNASYSANASVTNRYDFQIQFRVNFRTCTHDLSAFIFYPVAACLSFRITARRRQRIGSRRDDTHHTNFYTSHQRASFKKIDKKSYKFHHFPQPGRASESRTRC